MKIVAPVTQISEIDQVIDAGAAEIYCGVMPYGLMREYGIMFCLNRRPSPQANLTGYDDLAAIVRRAHARGVSVSATLNEFYPESQIAAALDQFRQVVRCGVDSVIISDIGLLYQLRREPAAEKCSICISNCGTAFNSETANFYGEHAVKRIILPRDLTMYEMESLLAGVKVPLEMEAFVLNQRCRNIDGFCSFQHGISAARQKKLRTLNPRKSLVSVLPAGLMRFTARFFMGNELACCLPYSLRSADHPGEREERNARRISGKYFNPDNFLNSCGACALYDFNRIGVGHVKIVGRCLFGDKKRDICFIKKCIGLLDGVASREEYTGKIRELRKTMFGRRMCSREYCYYPDIT